MMSKHIRYIVDDDEYLTCSICDDVIEEDSEIHHPDDEDVCGYCVQDKEIA